MSSTLTKARENLAKDRARVIYMESVESAYEAGKSIQVFARNDSEQWQECNNPGFYWQDYDYRIAVEPPTQSAIRQKILEEQSKLLETLYLSHYQKSVNECFRDILEFIG